MIDRTLARALTAALGLLALVSTDADAQGRVRGTARLSGEFGGEKVLEFQYEDGSTPDVVAGSGLLVTGGVVADLLRRPGFTVEGQLNAGLKYRTIPPATNQEATWLRFPVEGLVFYRAPAGFRVGGGVTAHLANSLRVSGDAADGRVDFGTSPGFVVQGEYVRNTVGFDLRYTALTYDVDGGGSVDASSFGVGISFYFGGRGR